jgi:hypothetical protein
MNIRELMKDIRESPDSEAVISDLTAPLRVPQFRDIRHTPNITVQLTSNDTPASSLPFVQLGFSSELLRRPLRRQRLAL